MAKKEIKVREIAPEEIKLDDRNLNRHTDKGRDLVNKSFSELGAGRSGVSDRNGKMIAGNLSVETAIEKGLKIVEVETEGDTYIVVKRKDLDLDSTTDNRARKLALADNSTAAVSLDWNWEEMTSVADDFGFEVEEWGVEVPDLGNTSMIDEVNRGDENSEWVGMPEFNAGEKAIKIVINFEHETDREEFANMHELEFNMKNNTTWSTTYPFKENTGSIDRKYETDEE